VHEIARGGDVTYHAPGQLVGYPILDLAARGRDLHAYLRALEETLIAALACLGVKGRQIGGKTGVFVEREAGDRGPDRKIASIGVGVRRWVSYHGFALNVSLDLSGFDAIVPCGLQGVEMTSIGREWQRRGRAPCTSQELDAAARDAVERAFRARFD
jgi:lipoate-protein ligase B